MELGSYFLFLQEQIKDIIIIMTPILVMYVLYLAQGIYGAWSSMSSHFTFR